LPGGSRAVVVAVAVLFALLAVTVLAWHSTKDQLARGAAERFRFRVSETRFAIVQRLAAYEQVLRGGVGLFAASREVDRDEWRAYVEKLRIEENYPGIRGIGYAEVIPPAQLDAHIRRVRAEGFPEYTVRPAGTRKSYTSIIYLEPFDWRNQRAFGYDMFSEPIRREAMGRARDSGLPAVSGKVTLVQETQQAVQQGFLMYLPVFKNGTAPRTDEERRAALAGYVYAPFRMNDLMGGTLGQDPLPNIRLQIFDAATPDAENLMFDSAAQDSDPAPPTFATDETFEVNGRVWLLRFNTLPAFDAAIDTQKPLIILLGGTLVSFLFAAVVWSLALNRQRTRELTEANRGLSAAKNAAEAASRAKDDFLANVSHELRTPLTLILAPLQQLLAARHSGTDWRAQIERVQRNALLLLNRVNDILDFSKAQAHKFTAQSERIDLPALVSALAEDAALVARSKGCTLNWQVDPLLDAVQADRRHLEKILLNLLSNALKFTPSGGWIRVAAAATDDAHYELSVADSGIGIAPDKLPLLFQRFQQIDTSATRQYGGTGIGLALVKDLAELMGGRAGVESQPERGSRFWVRLPRRALQKAPVEVAVNAESSPQAPDETATQLRRARYFNDAQAAAPAVSLLGARSAAAEDPPQPRILVADDNADMRGYVADLLRGDCEVVTAIDGLQAWELLQVSAVDAVVADVMMPRLDGLALAARIKAESRLCHLPVILVTARGGSDASAFGLEAGADDYIAKPFSPEELRARIHAALRMAQVQRALRDKTREAGIAMLAGGILHNLGNALSGVTLSSAVVHERIAASKVDKVRMVATLLQEAADSAERSATLARYVAELADHLESEKEFLLAEMTALRGCIEHALGVVASHRQLAAPATDQPQEPVLASGLMDAALALGRTAFELRDVDVERVYDYAGAVLVDRHKALQILINLLGNARDALSAVPRGKRQLRLRTLSNGTLVRLEISDNGTGIDPQHMNSLFNQGFSTKGPGHGYGLHSSADWARELGGKLLCFSAGPGCGASFVLELPVPATLDAAGEPAREVAEAAVRRGALAPPLAPPLEH
jgi:signal transduction histidine kinase